MYMKAVLSPPLGATTVVNSDQPLCVHFDAVLELSGDKHINDWQLELWYGIPGELWEAAPFNLVKGDTNILALGGASYRHRFLFVLDLDLETIPRAPICFTLRARSEEATPWIWIREQAGLEDGQMLFAKPQASLCESTSTPFEDIFCCSSPEIKITSVASEVSQVEVFEVSAPAAPNQWSTTMLGEPLGLKNFYAVVKLSSPWMGPRQGASTFNIDNDSLMTIFLRADGRYVVVLGLSALDDCTTYLQSENGRVIMKTRNDGYKQQYHRAIVATGLNDYQRVVNAAFYRARELLRTVNGYEDIEENSQVWQEETWYDGLVYCTWNGLGRELSEDKILDALQDLKEHGIEVSGLIIDDNWQSLDGRRWSEFEADDQFPHGLASTTTKVRQRFPSIKHIAVWHSIIGYWEGISPSGKIAQKYKWKTVSWRGGQPCHVVDASDVGRLYEDFYKFLSSSGVDSVKCDDQMSIDEFDNGPDRAELGIAYQDALRAASSRYFSSRVIYCMSHVPSIFFHALLPRRGPQTLFRNSDDFFPDIPDSHPWHIFANAMNCVYTHNLNSLPDWDMFQTALPEFGSYHTAARCISGGPIYITDAPGKHDMEMIKLMTATNTEGKTIILRPTRVAIPIDPFVEYNRNRLLKVSNFCGGYGGNILLAVFNISQTENTEVLQFGDFRGVIPDGQYVVRSHSTGRVFIIGPHSSQSVATLVLGKHGWDFFTAVPLHRFRFRGYWHRMSLDPPDQAEAQAEKTLSIGTFGLISALAGAAAVLNHTVEINPGRASVHITLKALGLLGLYISDLPSRKLEEVMILLNGLAVPISTVKKSKTDPTVLEVDVATAWKELGLSGRRQREVSFTAFFAV